MPGRFVRLALAALVATSVPATALVGPPAVSLDDTSCEMSCNAVSVLGDARCDDLCSALSILGDAEACRTGHHHAASHWPQPDCVAVSVAGDARCGPSPGICYAASGTGDAECAEGSGMCIAVSVTGGARGEAAFSACTLVDAACLDPL